VVKKREFAVKNQTNEFNFLYNMDRSTIKEELWIAVKFAKSAK